MGADSHMTIDVPAPCPPHPHPHKSSTPYLSHLPIICNNNTMDMVFPVQMRQSNKCGSVRNDEIINLHLRSGVGPRVSLCCLLEDTSHIYWFHPPKTINQQKPRNEVELLTNHIVLLWPTYTEPRLQRGNATSNASWHSLFKLPNFKECYFCWHRYASKRSAT